MTLPDGLQLPCRAIVRSSRADSEYSATVEILDGAGAPTGQILPPIPLDPLFEGRDGAGWFAPPKPGRIVGVMWAGGSAGHPIIVGPTWRRPAVPSIPVGPGEGALQDGSGGELRYQGDGKWHLIDGQGAELGVDGKLWLLRGDGDDLHAVQVAWLDALEALCRAMLAAQTIPDTDTDPGSAGRELPFNGATKAAISAVLAQVAVVRTREAKVMRS